MLKVQMEYNDQSARDRIKYELGTSFLVEAGAGSGKTTSLVERMLNLIATGTARMGEMAAITFTNKAASELLGRFRMKLEANWRQAPEGEEKERYALALRELGQIFIGTIHSFCGRLLRERPIEAGVDPAFRELEETEAREFRDRCWDEFMEQLEAGGDGGGSGLLAELAELGVSVEDLRVMYHRICQYEDVEIFKQATERPDLDRIRLSLFPLVEEAWRCMPSAAPAAGWDGLQEALRKARRMLRNLDMSVDRNVVMVGQLFDRSLQVTQNRWTEKAAAKELKERFQEWQISVLYPVLQEWREFLHPKIIRFVEPVIAYGRGKRMEAGVLDFQDLLMRTAELLRGQPGVRRYFAERYPRLFVDEFQDTDPIQAEMMLLLTGQDPEERDWKKQLPRPGSLFVVGDPKQSIYRFRRADISTYTFVKERIRLCGDVLELNKNFRSIHAVGDYVNYAFESKFIPKGAVSETQAEFVRMATQQANPKEKKALHGVYTMTYGKVDFDRKATIADMDSDRIARWIAWACSGRLVIQEREGPDRYVTRPAQPGDFLVLLKRKEYISLYAEKLERMGISSDTSGSTVVYEELQALRQLVDGLVDPSNKIPLLAILRGLLFGLSDDALYHYKREVGGFSWYGLPEPEHLSPKAAPVREVLQRLGVYAGWARELPALAAFARIIGDLGVLPYAAAGSTGAIRSGTLVRLLQLIQADPEAGASWSGLAAFLGRVMGTEAMEGTSLFAGAGSAVRIMNLHKAKGLEAPVVFLACPCGHNDHDASEHIDRLADPALGYFTISKPKTTFESEVVAQPVGWTGLSEKERRFMHAEEDRLLYVAATRAKQLLVVSRYTAKPAIDPWSKLEETLEKQPELDEVQVEAVQPDPMLAGPETSTEAAAAEQWKAAASVPTFRRTSVTELAKSGSMAELHRSGGSSGGMAYGTVVHRCLEAIGTGAVAAAEAGDFLRLAAAEEGLDDKWLTEAQTTVESVITHPLWLRAAQAKQRFHEFSFTVAKDDGATLVKGVIDLLFEEADGWVIVDFKTDSYEEGHLADFVEFYRPQVTAYVEEWQRFGYPVKEAVLWFLKGNRVVEL